MKILEMRELSSDEIRDRREELLRELINLRAQQRMGQLESPIRLRDVRRRIARLLTVLREKELVNA
ncbi:50S ribosomal protein L29 [bacterium]|nr:50S ribosomal protein L29 [bacterium]MBU1614992.1 50S ribosomal protein L29 [bacterium]